MSMMDVYMVDEITINRWEGYNSFGEPESGTAIDVKGYVEWKTHLVRNIKGEQVTSTVMIYLSKKKVDAALGRPLSLEDRILIPLSSLHDAHYGHVTIPERAIIEIRMPKDFSRPHYEVFLA